jgi:hypothetical protein
LIVRGYISVGFVDKAAVETFRGVVRGFHPSVNGRIFKSGESPSAIRRGPPAGR